MGLFGTEQEAIAKEWRKLADFFIDLYNYFKETIDVKMKITCLKKQSVCLKNSNLLFIFVQK